MSCSSVRRSVSRRRSRSVDDDVEALGAHLEPYRGHHVACGLGAATYLGPVELWLGKAALHLGRDNVAVTELSEAVRRGRESGAAGCGFEAIADLASGLLRQGNSEEVRTLVATSLPIAEQLGLKVIVERPATCRDGSPPPQSTRSRPASANGPRSSLRACRIARSHSGCSCRSERRRTMCSTSSPTSACATGPDRGLVRVAREMVRDLSSPADVRRTGVPYRQPRDHYDGDNDNNWLTRGAPSRGRLAPRKRCSPLMRSMSSPRLRRGRHAGSRRGPAETAPGACGADEGALDFTRAPVAVRARHLRKPTATATGTMPRRICYGATIRGRCGRSPGLNGLPVAWGAPSTRSTTPCARDGPASRPSIPPRLLRLPRVAPRRVGRVRGRHGPEVESRHRRPPLRLRLPALPHHRRRRRRLGPSAGRRPGRHATGTRRAVRPATRDRRRLDQQ